MSEKSPQKHHPAVAPMQAGMTLLETLIALSLLGLIMTVLSTSLSFGGQIWQRQTDAKVEQGGLSRSASIALLERLFFSASAIVVRNDNMDEYILFQGDDRQITFVVPFVARSGLAVPHVVTLSEIDNISFKNNTGRSLALTLQPMLDGIVGELQFAEQRVLMNQLSDFSIGYFGSVPDTRNQDWSDNWSDRSELPILVRLNFRMEGDSENQHWDFLLRSRALVEYNTLHGSTIRSSRDWLAQTAGVQRAATIQRRAKLESVRR